ncbi:MAG: hypothetical protein LBO65_11115 [Spirochaetaceae bacterium]|jgi:hypothetical protein|nr:hypothetical protein [Spirochaetaceae bacterium]
MKQLLIVFGVITLFGCASLKRDKYYADMARENSFADYFPSHSFRKSFSTIEEAYDYINAALAKFSQVSGKPAAKGLAARLTGPAVQTDQPVALGCFMEASGRQTSIDLVNSNKSLDTNIREAISATLVFLIFYEDRGVSISRFYLQQGWQYVSNAQYEEFNTYGNSYTAEYPAGWGTEKAFAYLKKEID